MFFLKLYKHKCSISTLYIVISNEFNYYLLYWDDFKWQLKARGKHNIDFNTKSKCSPYHEWVSTLLQSWKYFRYLAQIMPIIRQNVRTIQIEFFSSENIILSYMNFQNMGSFTQSMWFCWYFLVICGWGFLLCTSVS